MTDVGKRLGQANELTVIFPIKHGEEAALRQTLADSALAAQNLFAGIPTVHYARWTILHLGQGDEAGHLLFSSNYDGAFDDYMAALAATIPAALARIWSHCEGWPDDPAPTPAVITYFITDHVEKAALFYSAYPDVTVREVKRALKMQQAVQTLFDALQE
jgi:hypothetical protein